MNALYRPFPLFFLVLLIVLPGQAQHVFQPNSGDQVFMQQAYLSDIADARSVSAVPLEPSTLLGFRIEQIGANYTLYGFTRHEGGIEVALMHDPNKRILISTDPEFPWELEIVDKQHLKLRDQKSEQDTFLYAVYPSIETAFRNQLISGSYLDSNGNSVRFSPDGTLTNFTDDHPYFEIEYDFGLGIDFDVLTTYSSVEGGNLGDGNMYHFVVESNRLLLYEVHSDWETLEHSLSENPIVLVRQPD